MENYEKNYESPRVGIAIVGDLKIKVDVLGEFFSHGKTKYNCEAKSGLIDNFFVVPHTHVVFLEDFDKG